MIERRLLFGSVCVGFVVIVITSVSLWALWEACSYTDACDDLDQQTCNATRYCYFVETERENDHEVTVNSCRHNNDIDLLAGFGFFFSLIFWVGFFALWFSDHPQNMRPGANYSAGVCFVLVTLIFAVYLLAMWMVLKSTTALVFSIIFGTISGAVALGGIALRVADWYEQRQPPNYTEISELHKI